MTQPLQKRVIVTGSAGFIGSHVCLELLKANHIVLGIDNLNDYYDVNLKLSRLERLKPHPQFSFETIDVADAPGIKHVWQAFKPTHVVHLAAQAGVRYSLSNPQAYIDANITGFLSMLEAARSCPVAHLVYASSSSVYGANTVLPFATDQKTDAPVSLYGATKKANELMAHSYAHLFQIPMTGLRFFTVYGPWGRPDMALFLFTRSILEGKAIDVFGEGEMQRDFTYVDDIVEGILRVLSKPPEVKPPEENVPAEIPHQVFNIGNHTPVPLMEMIRTLERALGKDARLSLLPMQAGDVRQTHADVSDLYNWTGWRPSTSIQQGIPEFVKWYKGYYST